MGRAAEAVQEHLRDSLAARHPAFDWSTEYRVGRTPVDIGGESEHTLVLVELEWRWADPANNTVKLFRHLVDETLSADTVLVRQLFTNYYDPASGGISSKRENAEFVGERVARTFEHVDYAGVTLPIDPPKRGGEMPVEWQHVVVETASSLFECRVR